jgi:hypothetical protein
MSFALDLSKFAAKAMGRADEAVKRIVLNVAANLDKRSPVGNPDLWQSPPPKGYVGGRFRGNWQYGNYAGAGIPMNETGKIDPSGEATQGAIAAAIPDKAAGIRHVLINNVPYAMVLERGRVQGPPASGSYQAPSGMVGLAVVEFQQSVDEAVAAMSKG